MDAAMPKQNLLMSNIGLRLFVFTSMISYSSNKSNICLIGYNKFVVYFFCIYFKAGLYPEERIQFLK